MCIPGEDGDKLIGVGREWIANALPDAVEAAQDTVAGSFPHCYPLVGSSSSLHSETETEASVSIENWTEKGFRSVDI